jgi:hypothetical protein
MNFLTSLLEDLVELAYLKKHVSKVHFILGVALRAGPNSQIIGQ